MVSVVVVRPFYHLGHPVSDGQCIELEAIDAAVKAHEGLVSLLHGRTYQTRDMVAAPPVHAVALESSADPSTDPVSTTPPKRRRGRPRKVRD